MIGERLIRLLGVSSIPASAIAQPSRHSPEKCREFLDRWTATSVADTKHYQQKGRKGLNWSHCLMISCETVAAPPEHTRDGALLGNRMR